MRLDDACRILECTSGATLEEAQKRYRKLALQHHPDRCPDDPGATAKFQTIGEAWARFQRFKKDGFSDPITDDSFNEERYEERPTGSWFSQAATWWGSGGGSGGSYYYGGDYGAAPTRCGPGCTCRFCEIERKRTERRAKAAEEEEARQKRAAAAWAKDEVRVKEASRKAQEAIAREKREAAEAAAARAAAAAADAADAAAAAEQEAAREAERRADRERHKAALKKARSALRSALGPAAISDDDLGRLCGGLELDGLQSLAREVTAALGEGGEAGVAAARAAVVAALAALAAAAAAAEAAAEEEAAARAPSGSAAGGADRKVEWTTQELSLLAKAMNKVPGGSAERWTKVAEMVGPRTNRLFC